MRIILIIAIALIPISLIGQGTIRVERLRGAEPDSILITNKDSIPKWTSFNRLFDSLGFAKAADLFDSAHIYQALTDTAISIRSDFPIGFSGKYTDLDFNSTTGLSDGIDNVDDADNDATNELSDLNLAGNTLTLTNPATGANSVDLTGFANTDTQDLSIDGTGHIISLVDGGSVTITDNVDDADNDPTNELDSKWDEKSGDRIQLNASNARVGIGMSPSHPLDVLGNSRVSGVSHASEHQASLGDFSWLEDRTGSNGTSGQFLSQDASGLRWKNDPNYFYTNGSGRAILKSEYTKLGIGMSPSHPLDVLGNSRVSGISHASEHQAPLGDFSWLEDRTGSNGTSGQYLSQDASGLRWLNDPNYFYTNGSGRAILKSEYTKLGIGMSPSHPLDVLGNSRVSGVSHASEHQASLGDFSWLEDRTGSNGTSGQYLSQDASGLRWLNIAWSNISSIPSGFSDGIDDIGTDNQNISGSGLSGTNLTIGIENGSNQVVDLSSLQGEDADFYKIGTSTAPTLITENVGRTGNMNLGTTTTDFGNLLSVYRSDALTGSHVKLVQNGTGHNSLHFDRIGIVNDWIIGSENTEVGFGINNSNTMTGTNRFLLTDTNLKLNYPVSTTEQKITFQHSFENNEIKSVGGASRSLEFTLNSDAKMQIKEDNIMINNYINTRNDFDSDLPKNKLYTDAAGTIHSAPVGTFTYKNISGNYTALATDYIIYCNTASGDITLSLPGIDGGRGFYIVKTSASNDIIINPSGSTLIDGSTLKIVSTNDKSIFVHHNGTEYRTLSETN